MKVLPMVNSFSPSKYIDPTLAGNHQNIAPLYLLSQIELRQTRKWGRKQDLKKKANQSTFVCLLIYKRFKFHQKKQSTHQSSKYPHVKKQVIQNYNKPKRKGLGWWQNKQ